MKRTLWTRDFTRITAATALGAAGGIISQFALSCAREHPAYLEQLTATGKLPIAVLSAESGVDRKTMERHRKYLVALLLAFTNGFEIIRGHLRQMARPVKEVK